MEKPTKKIRGTTPEIALAARRLRQNSTPAEQILWQALRGRQLNGLKFRRQHPVGQFVVDFYCPQSKLVIELDGEVHTKQAEHDTARTDQLNAYGYRVLRFQNQEVLASLTSVLERILSAAKDPHPASGTPLPNLGEGTGERAKQS